MARTAAAISRQKELAERRRAQILSAARACVLAEGFHTTTIDRIAAVSSISHGQVYRYFENKEAIMLALSESEFEELMLHITQLLDYTDLSVDVVINTFRNEIPWLGDRAALALDVLAEAGRNPKVAELVVRWDRRLRNAFRKIIEVVLDGLDENEIEVRIQMLVVMTRALAVHVDTRPPSDPQMLPAGFELVLRGVLSASGHYLTIRPSYVTRDQVDQKAGGLASMAARRTGMDQAVAPASRREERTERRQAQILSAARACVRAEGFYAASMSRIADKAEMSVGHIYRYFENKEAIMLALSEHDFEEFMLRMTQLDHFADLNADLVIRGLLSDISWLFDYQRASLALDVLAEAGRNPKFQNMVARVDARFRSAMRKIIENILDSVTDNEMDTRVEILLVMTRALAVHAGTHPISNGQLIVTGYELALRSVLSPARHLAARRNLGSAER